MDQSRLIPETYATNLTNSGLLKDKKVTLFAMGATVRFQAASLGSLAVQHFSFKHR
jgi:hypothetical protein